MDSFGCPDNFFIRGVQLAVTDVIFDGAGKEEIVLRHNPHLGAQAFYTYF